ncbi:MAG: 3-keto-disaccharide hydrolase [Bacteroidota bacterium]
MRKMTLSLAGLLIVMLTYGQNDRHPETTEIWEPVPPKVTTGEQGAAPSDAIILFNGNDLSKWQSTEGGEAKWKVENNAVTVVPQSGAIKTKDKFGSCQLHIEWRSPSEIKGEGQGRGNSGIFLMERYELQVLDSYESKTYPNGQAASIYKQYIPLVNACKAPGEWQTYDIIFTAPTFGEDGRMTTPARFTVLHNGVLVQNNVALLGPTEYIGMPVYKAHEEKASIVLQDHGNPVSFRNIWIREL